MLIQNIFVCDNSIFPLIAKIKKINSGFNLRWEKLKIPERKDRLGDKKVAVKSAIMPRLRKSWLEIFRGQDRSRGEVGPIGSKKEQKRLGTQVRRYILNVAIFMFWPSFTSFHNIIPSFGFFFSHPHIPVFLVCIGRRNFLTLRCYLFLSSY